MTDKVKDKLDFFDELVEAVAKKVSESNILSHEIAERLKNDPKVLELVLHKLEPGMLGRIIAREIIRANETSRGNHVNDMLLGNYISIMKQARIEAGHIIAQDMASKISDEVTIA